jgi:intracellular sulfur oxidation DsrE/DsrF family protein
MRKQITKIFTLLLLPFLMVTNVLAEQDTPHKVIIQVSTDDVSTQKMALNNAANLQKLYGLDNVLIEIVAYGPGLGLLTTESTVASRVESLVLQDITFSACQNTMDAQKQKTGLLPVLLDGVTTVNAGVARIMELQEQGYAYIRP